MISLQGVSKKFILRHHKVSRLKEQIIDFLKGTRYISEEFWALKDITFTVDRGETVGILGENGSGKSTLLQLLAGILVPDQGKLEVKGKVAPLIELGAGFNPELTGRENIYLNGSILGFKRKEIHHKLEDIIAFSGLQRFIDQPVKNYSSGMYMRLAFSISIHVDPDILLVDEILAVGDLPFQQECFKRIQDFKNKGKTIILVSHDLHILSTFCDRALLLHKGELIAQGNTREVIARYVEILKKPDRSEDVKQGTGPSSNGELQRDDPSPQMGKRWGSGEIEITRVTFLDKERNETCQFKTHDPFIARIYYVAHRRIKKPVFGLALISEKDNIQINGPNTRFDNRVIEYLEDRGYVEYIIDRLPLLPGDYWLLVSVWDYECQQVFDAQDRMHKFKVIPGGTPERYGLISIPARWEYYRDQNSEARKPESLES
ncbi:MAG TPA: ABC transporter ATP-binding protein [Candidatus Limnocylindrales bacterium]|nr:ABC transporter ATP-binding protein [Candidatus Limnocylindrales bacterium]